MKFPLNEQWKIDPSADRGLNLLGVRNISFEDRKLARLAPRSLRLYDTTDDADFEAPAAFYNSESSGEIDKMYCIDNDPYDVNINTPTSISKDQDGTQPSGSLDGSGVVFNDEFTVSTSSRIHTNDGSTWTDRGALLSTGFRHPLCVFKNRSTLLAGNGNTVKQFNTSFATTTDLVLPGGLEVTGIAYNRNLAAIVCASAPGEGYLFIWDGATASANYGYPLNSSRAVFVAPYKGTFVTLTGDGELLYWNGSGLERLAALPSYFKSYQLGELRRTNRTICHDTSVVVRKDRIYMNLVLENEAANQEPFQYEPLQPSGLWVYDPLVGLYHRNGHTLSKIIEKNIQNSNIDTGTDIITTTDVPDTGTAVILAEEQNVLGGVTPKQTYYTIKLSSTTFQLAETIADAEAGTAVDITSVEAGTIFYDFTFLPIPDFGQLHTDGIGFALAYTGNKSTNSTETALHTDFVFGVESDPQLDLTETDTLSISSSYGENRGLMITQKLFAPEVTATWQKLLVKARGIKRERDKILLKARTEENSNYPVFCNESNPGTWVDSTSFTTDENLSQVKTDFDAGKRYEIEFTRGAGSGYIAHISNITESSGTYTVTIDETIENISTGNKCLFIIDNWERVRTSEDTDSPDTESNKDFIEFSFGDGYPATKWIQLRFELRGNNVAVEEYELIFDSHKLPT